MIDKAIAMVEDLTKRLDAASFRLCGGYYEPKNDQEAADGVLMLEAKQVIETLMQTTISQRESANTYSEMVLSLALSNIQLAS